MAEFSRGIDLFAKRAALWRLAVVLFFAVHGSGFGAEIRQPMAPEQIDWAKEQQFWSFQAPQAQARPAVKNKSWPRQPLDYFVLARLEDKKLKPSAEVDKRTLIRRATFDLTGLPPTPEEVDAFLKDKSANAYEQLVERLLASPAFGERMASLWLPLARYAEDQAHQVGDDIKFFYPNAYLYREWVINAFNHDVPYDQFIRLQLAADKVEPGNTNNLAALGFLGLGPKYYNRGRLDVLADEWEDRVDTVTRSFLGLTVACARCHDHKFDPITTSDYYALAGVFASTKMVNKKMSPEAEPEPAKDSKNDPKAKTKKDDKEAFKNTMHIVEDDKPQDLNIFIRGNVDRKGPVVERRFLQILSHGTPAPFKDGSGREDLAEAIANRANPLTARVMVNRIWGLLYGKPLVATPSNFGHSGMTPSNPALLDDLSVRFMEHGWSIKSLMREMVLSATYRQTAHDDAKKSTIDASNELLWKMNRRRLTVEQFRDSALFVSGQLEPIGGRSLELTDATNHHRTVYARISRLKLNDMLIQFDYPDANVHAEKRSVTTTALQKLFLLNSGFMLSQSQALAQRLEAVSTDDKTRVQAAYRLLFGREADKTEIKLALDFLRKPAVKNLTRWEEYAQILLASNEMTYVD